MAAELKIDCRRVFPQEIEGWILLARFQARQRIRIDSHSGGYRITIETRHFSLLAKSDDHFDHVPILRASGSESSPVDIPGGHDYDAMNRDSRAFVMFSLE